MRLLSFILFITTSSLLCIVTCLTLPPSFQIRDIFGESRDDHLCGRQLIEALYLVCNGNYNTPHNKRSYRIGDNGLIGILF